MPPTPGTIPDTDEDWAQPYRLSKELGVYASIIYGYMKTHRCTVKEIGGKPHVLRSEIMALRESGGAKRGFAAHPRTKAVREDSGQDAPPVRPGAIVTWGTKTGKRIAQVSTLDDTFTKLRDIQQKEILFRNTSMRKLLKDGTMSIESPLALLRMVADSFRPIDLRTALELDAIVESVAPEIPHLVEEDSPAVEELPDFDGEGDSMMEDEQESID